MQQVANSGSNPLERLPENEAGRTVKKAIAEAGGWEKWAAKKTFSYVKTMEYFDSTGVRERQLQQLHQYQLQPQFKARINWEEGGDQFVIINDGQQAWKYKNGVEMTDQASRNQAWNSSFGSHYVVSMPFKLTDPGVILTDEGLDTLPGKKAVLALKVAYEKGVGSAGGIHVWRYYFDKETYRLAANFLDYGEGYSFTTYETFKTVDGILVAEERHGYTVNAQKEVGRLRSIYRNEEMQFDVPLADSLFESLN